MHALRWITRALLLLVVVALAAGCAAPDEAGGDPQTRSDVPMTQDPPGGCIQEGQTGDGSGGIASNETCPTGSGAANDTAVNGTTAG